MASNEDSESSKARASSNPSSQTNKTSRPGSQAQQASGQPMNNSSAFSHPGAGIISQRAKDGDGPYRCRKCGDAVLTVSVIQCPGCQDNYPWFAQDENLLEGQDLHAQHLPPPMDSWIKSRQTVTGGK